MARIDYNKLVRDKIKEKLEGKGVSHEIVAIENDEEYKELLMKKILEEAEELSNVDSKDAFLSESTDLMIILDAARSIFGVTEQEVLESYQKNVNKKGKFAYRHKLLWADDEDYK